MHPLRKLTPTVFCGEQPDRTNVKSIVAETTAHQV